MPVSQHSLHDFSPHLFWDVDKQQTDLEAHKPQIIQQVLEYGLLADWLLIRDLYGINEIAKTAATFRQLDPKALTFISTLSGRTKESFRCYNTKPSTAQRWNF